MSCQSLREEAIVPSYNMSSQPTAARFQGDGSQPIAIIGFSARLPQEGGSTAGFWKLLCEGRSAASAIPKERFNIDAFYHPDVDRIDTVCLKTQPCSNCMMHPNFPSRCTSNM